MEAGRSGRVEETDKKEHPFDFALWKKSEDDEIGWDSPWGRGRPGWHIECSVMSMEYLGETLDIHGGGRDLIFPHHENEIAQSEATSGQAPFANFWMHVGMVNVAETNDEGEEVVRKMSKSLGNFWTTRDVLGGYHPEAIRYFMHTTLYRNPITYAVSNLEEATHRIEYLYTALKRAEQVLERGGWDAVDNPPQGPSICNKHWELVDNFMERYEEALADDVNTPKALALIGEVARAINESTQSDDEPTEKEAFTLYRLRDHLMTAGEVLGILERSPEEALSELRELRLHAMELDPADIDEKVAAREEARTNQDWERADAIRDELDEMGVEIMDSPEGTTWRMK